MEKITAVVLAAGAGKRMHSDVHKQYMMLAGRPVLFYALQAFAESAVTDIVVVVGAGEIDYCRKEIIEISYPKGLRGCGRRTGTLSFCV